MKYSLAKYSFTISSNDEAIKRIFGESLTIGGQGSTTDDITVSQANAPMAIKSYATGGYVFEQTFDRHGTASISISQVSDAVNKLKQLLNLYYTKDFEPLTIVVTDNEGNQVASCKDCHLNSVPNQKFAENVGQQDWSFDVGVVTFY